MVFSACYRPRLTSWPSTRALSAVVGTVTRPETPPPRTGPESRDRQSEEPRSVLSRRVAAAYGDASWRVARARMQERALLRVL